jgi:S-adenosylmethionine:tRNA ribosyltransferase-isomerase
MQKTDFHFELPPRLIAQTPTSERSASRLLTIDGADGRLADRQFRDLPTLLRPSDLLVFNDTRVVPARVFGTKQSGGRIEILLERALDARRAAVHVRASKGLRQGAVVELAGGCRARMLARDGELFVLEFSSDVMEFFAEHGRIPLPPYIERDPDAADAERYQTVYARAPGAVAAPTAGLHFDAATFAELASRGIGHAFVTLHVGAGTFSPIRSDDIDAPVMHEEHLDVPIDTCRAIEAARAAGGRVVAVGTTVVRSLETAARGGALQPFRGSTDIFIKPGHRFRAVDALVTNFHLPQSTLLMLCAAFVGREKLLAAYAHAVADGYRFFSYGDAMFMLPDPAAAGS